MVQFIYYLPPILDNMWLPFFKIWDAINSKTLGLIPDVSDLIKDVLQNMVSYIILYISHP